MLKRHWPVLVLGCAILASTLLLLYLSRGLAPLVDQWGYIYAYRSWSLETLLTPHNGHLMALSILLYKAMFAVFGVESQVPYQLVNYALSATVASLLFVLMRNRVGDLLALAAAVLMLFYGAGADVIMPTFAFPNLLGLALGLAALLALRRASLKGDLATCVLLTVSVVSYSIGIVFIAGAIAAIALRPPGQRLRRVWVVLVPLATYLVWALWASKFDQTHIYVHNLKIIGSALVDQVSAVMAGLTGLFTTPNGPLPTANPVPIRTTWGPVLVAGLAVLAYVRMRRLPKPGPGAVVAIVVLIVYLLLVGIALNQFRNTFDTRFVYVGSVLLLLAVAELLAPYRPSRAALAGVGVVFVFSMCANVAELGDVAQSLRAQSSLTRAKLAAVELAGPAAEESAAVEESPRGNELLRRRVPRTGCGLRPARLFAGGTGGFRAGRPAGRRRRARPNHGHCAGACAKHRATSRNTGPGSSRAERQPAAAMARQLSLARHSRRGEDAGTRQLRPRWPCLPLRCTRGNVDRALCRPARRSLAGASGGRPHCGADLDPGRTLDGRDADRCPDARLPRCQLT